MKRLSRALLLWMSLQVLITNAYIPSIHPSQKAQQQKQQRPREIPPIGSSYASPLFRDTRKRKTVILKPVLRRNPLRLGSQQYDMFRQQNQVNPGLASQDDLNNPPPQQQQQEEAREKRKQQRQSIFIFSSAALAGVTDVLCLAQYGCFVNMMTGNMLKATTALVNSHSFSASHIASNSDIWVPASFALSYMVGVTIFGQLQDLTSSKLHDRDEDDEENVLAPMRYVAPLVAVSFLGADLLGAGRTAQKAIQVPLLAMGFGVVNSAAAQATGNTIFFAMTGHLTKTTHYLRQFAKRRVWDPDAATATSLKVLRGFLGGAITAALMLRYCNILARTSTLLGLSYTTLFAWYTCTPSLMASLMVTTIHNLQQRFRFSVSLGLQRLGYDLSKRDRLISSAKELVQIQSLVDLLPTTPTQPLL